LRPPLVQSDTVTELIEQPPSSRYSLRILLILFLLSLSLLNPWVRGDGVGYYALARAPLIEHAFDFTHDYQLANASFRERRLDENGLPRDIFRTTTGHLDNHFSVGPAILWSPFLLVAHLGVLVARALGSSVPADGFAAPYRLAMAFATCLYGFLGLLLSYRLACRHVSERWALLATISVWWASSLPVYMYFSPSWSHAHSAFVVALFLYYWHVTHVGRTTRQWLVLAIIAGLMLNVYYANAMLLAVPAVEAFSHYRAALRRDPSSPKLGALFFRHVLFAAVLLVCLLPTFLTRSVIYGSPFASGYIPLRFWLWRSPAFLLVLFSSNHGLLLWTPLLLFSIVGLFLFARRQPLVGVSLLFGALAFYAFISVYPDWAGISSFGNRFFISLTPLFILGLAVLLDASARLFASRRAFQLLAPSILAFFVLWNLGLMFQWGTHLVPARGPVDVREMIANQFTVVPRSALSRLHSYFFRRRDLMRQIEERDQEQLKQSAPPN
jgi:hypothetical protein